MLRRCKEKYRPYAAQNTAHHMDFAKSRDQFGPGFEFTAGRGLGMRKEISAT